MGNSDLMVRGEYAFLCVPVKIPQCKEIATAFCCTTMLPKYDPIVDSLLCPVEKYEGSTYVSNTETKW
eukprot:CAMPEP_0119159510 /NCGR_PEP_ID=MMETSP1310-20130426/53798_1 /TAXON_ID=464262 /ORGANISM="Genus nov. species nov., Strain RCC2339" /LENGTH=67 /DNA_ID=CAMNT_0007152139 /DNA_START=685 /DNA_END=885 /DNA_ORIENTATION=-